MVDLETIGSNPDAPIVSIGAVFFEPSTGETGPEFYQVVDLTSAMNFGAKPDASTILWWMKQSSEARSALLVEDAADLDVALTLFSEFLCGNAANGAKSVQVWGNGASFDNVLLKQSYELVGGAAPWRFVNDRDVRTIVELGNAVGINPRYDIPFEGEKHNALADALHQAKYVSAIWQRLTAN
ncbi:3'-5' exonuclease [Atlantibacter hermannii]|uniref:3'-5' exonuclease n=1 Tax=Atlantibacter hermannii TaxID=565 RepID=UPI0028AC7539|nr:3'-5' exonuclease [Atlantibacter hermannii]